MKLREAIYGTKVRSKAAELGISEKGKDIEGLAKAVYEAEIQTEAKKFHIDLYGKDIYQVLREINEQKVIQVAEELGIDRTNTSTQELAGKIKNEQPEKLQELTFSPWIQTDADAFYYYLTN